MFLYSQERNLGAKLLILLGSTKPGRDIRAPRASRALRSRSLSRRSVAVADTGSLAGRLVFRRRRLRCESRSAAAATGLLEPARGRIAPEFEPCDAPG